MVTADNTAQEVWRPVPYDGYEHLYDVSNLGRVRRGCRILRQGRSGHLHLKVDLWKDGARKGVNIHRMVALAFLGDPPTPGHQVAHWDGNGRNNRADNLRWATGKENEADKLRHGTSNFGSTHHKTKLTKDQVLYIMECRKNKSRSAISLAKEYSVNISTIVSITRGKSWRHLFDEVTLWP